MLDRRKSKISGEIGARRGYRTDVLPVHVQSAALCYRFRVGQPEILLITTRRSGRWIIPKGWLIPGLSPSQTAEREAWEEAGVSGRCGSDSIGQFTYVKNRATKGPALCNVRIFPLHVQTLAKDFPEAGERQRRWVSPEDASNLVISRELAAALSDFARFLQ